MGSSLKTHLILSLLLTLILLVQSTEVSHDGRALTINGERRIILSGSIHYPRSTPEMWPDLIKKAKEGGLDAIETYVFWNAHEPVRRQYDFNGNNDLIRFLKTVHEAGLYAVLRIGPYVCAEWNYGGFPVWLHNMPGIELRTANDVFMNEMKNFTTLIVNMAKQEKLFASQGGPIIIAQIENEYGNVISSYGDSGKAYRDWCADMAESQNIGVPWIMCQEDDAPQPMINTCNGWYCDQFTPNDPNSPKMWTENWTGWFKSWGGRDPHRMAEDVAYSVARFFQSGGTFQNYYMYHGGTNFGRTSGGPYITTSYDYDAPLDEYGNLNQPKWGHLKELHETLKSMEKTLTHGNSSSIDMGNSVTITKYTTETNFGCFISNTNTTGDATVSYGGDQHFVPAWSVSILPDCQTEVYNTAKVNTQTTIMVKKSNQAKKEHTSSLKWSWMPERINHTLNQLVHGDFSANQLIDQKAATSDSSDYLWYRTEVMLSKEDPVWSDNMTLRINASGHVLHSYVNGEYIASKWANYGVFNYVFDTGVKFKQGRNSITLLSATVGLQNYGPKFDMIETGVPGPVVIVSYKGDETIIKDLSSNKWTYKVGLHGIEGHQYFHNGHAAHWTSSKLPTNRMMTWYKTAFKPPLGTDPVVVDLEGMGKGHAWVNGHSLGRFWPSYLAEADGCSSDPCDYRGSYSSHKCVTNCGKPTQIYYHVPRSFLHEDKNILVLFEELGGNPTSVSFKTVTVGKACVNAPEGKTAVLACQGGARISDVEFAVFGDPQGACGAFTAGGCQTSKDVLSIVRKACVGKEACSLEVSESKFGSVVGPMCSSDLKKKLAVQVVC